MITSWLSRHRKLLTWLAGGVAVLLVATAGTGYALVRHLNSNLTQVDLATLLGKQFTPPKANQENILFIGADNRGAKAESDGDTYPNEADTITLLHIQPTATETDLVSIPRVTYVHIPSCRMPDGSMSKARNGTLGEAFAIPDADNKHDGLGAACVIKAIEADAGVQIDHFIAADFSGLQNAVKALGGVKECLTKAVRDPNSGITLPAGCHLLTPAQALAFVRARSDGGAGTQLERIERGQSFIDELLETAQSKLLNPVATYNFLDAITSSLTIDSSFGGVQGLYALITGLHNTPPSEIQKFTTPEVPDKLHKTDKTPDGKWTAQDGKIFGDIDADLPVPKSIQ